MLAASVLLLAGAPPAFAYAPAPDGPAGRADARPPRLHPDPGAQRPAPAQGEQARKRKATVDDLRDRAARQPQPDRATGSFQVSAAVGTFLRAGLGLPVESNLLTGLARDKAAGTLRVQLPSQPHLRDGVPAGVQPPSFGRTTLVADPATGALTVTASGDDAALTVHIRHAAANTLDFTSQVTVRVPVLGTTVSVSGPLTYSTGSAAGVSLSGSVANPIVLEAGVAQLDSGATVTLTPAGLGVAGTADLGPAAHRLRAGVRGRLAGTDSWSLAVGDAPRSTTGPVPGLTLATAMTGTVTGDHTGVRYDVHGRSTGGWHPVPGVSVNRASVRFSNVAPTDATLTPPGAGPATAWLDVTGDVGLAAGSAGAVPSRGTVTVNLDTGAAALSARQSTAVPMRGSPDRAVLDGGRFAGRLTVKPDQISGSVTGTGVLTTTLTTGKRHPATTALQMSAAGVLTATAPPTTTTPTPAATPAAKAATAAGTTTYTLSADAYTFLTQKLGIPLGSSPTISGTLSGQTLTLTVGAPGQLPLTLPAGVPAPSFGPTTVVVDEAAGTLTLNASATAGVTATLQVTIRHAGTTTLSGGADLTTTLTLGGVPFVAGATVTLTGHLTYTGGTLAASLTGSLDSAISLAGGAVTLQAGTNLSIATGGGLTVHGTALLGSGENAFTLTVDGSVTDLRNWSLSVTNPAGESWQPVPSLTLYPNFTATLTDRAGTIGFDLNSTGTATWSPASGATMSVTAFEVSNQAPAATVHCPATADGDVWLDLRGSFGYTPSGMAPLNADACVDLTSRGFQIRTTVPGRLLPNNPTFNLTDASLTATGNLTTHAFAVTGSAGVTVPSPSGGPGVTGLTAAVSFTNNTILAGVEVPDLSALSSSLAGSATLYISSTDIAGFRPADYGLTGGVFPSTIPLRAGVNIAYKYTVASLPSNVTSALNTLHVSIPAGTSILAVAQVSTTGLSASLDVNFGTDAGGAQLFNSHGAAFFLDDITLSISVGTTGGNVTLAGGGYLEMPKMWNGGAASQVEVTASASLNLSTLSPVLSLRLSNWNNALGVPGLTVRNFAASFAVSPNPSIALSANSVTMPTGWPQAIGLAAGAQISMDATVSLTQPVVRFWISGPGGSGTALTPLAVGYASQIAAGTPLTPGQQSIVDSLQIQSAAFYLAPFGGTTAAGLTMQPGLALSFTAVIDHVLVSAEASIGVAPPSLSIDVSTDNFSVGALTISNTRFFLSIDPTQFTFGFKGGYTYGANSFTIAVSLVFGDSANGASLEMRLTAGLPSYLMVSTALQGSVSGDGTGASLAAGGWGGFWVNGHQFGSVYFSFDLSTGLHWGDWLDDLKSLAASFVRYGASTNTIITALTNFGYSFYDILNALGANGVFSSDTLSTLESALNPFSTTYYDIWTYTSSGQLLVLDVSGGSQTADTQVITWPFNVNGHNQQWAFVADPAFPGWYEVVNRNSGQCLSDYGNSTAAGSPLVQYPCFGGYDQLWYFGSINLATTYVVTNGVSGLVMDVQSAYPWPGGTLDQWPYNGGTNQQFWLTNSPR